MLKINKSILIICIISLFLIIGQVTASDNDLTEINDLDASTNPIKMDNLNSSSERIDTNNNALCDLNILNNQNSENQNISMSPNSKNQRFDENISSEKIENMDKSADIFSEDSKDITGIVMANDNYSCGPASLATVLNRYGLNLTLNEVSQHTNTSLNGTSMQSLIDAAKYYNFSAFGVEIYTENLQENHIVHLDINGNQHWSVITKVTDTHVFLADSTAGNINLSLEEFNSYFTKKAIVLSNQNAIDMKEQIISNQITILDRIQCLSIYGKGMKRKIIGYKTVWKYGFIQKYGWVLRPVVSGGHVSFSKWKYVKGYYNVWGKYKVKQPIYKYYYVSDDALTSAKIKKNKK